jgi:hypothetical protein
MRSLGTLTPATVKRARQLAACAPVPDPETIARLRALLGLAPVGAAASRAA